MRKNRLPRAVRVRPQMDPAVFFFSVSFLLGGNAGYFSCCGMGIDAEIRTYLTQYAEVLSSGGSVTAASALSVAAAYYRVPCMVFLCRSFRRAFYWHCGVFLFEGSLLSFAVSSLALALGQVGVLVSLCVSVSGISLFCRSHFLWRCVADLLLSQDPGGEGREPVENPSPIGSALYLFIL